MKGQRIDLIGRRDANSVWLRVNGAKVPFPTSHLRLVERTEGMAGVASVPTPDVRIHVRIEQQPYGLLVTEVFTNGLGEQIGMRASDVLLTVNGTPVRSESQLMELFARPTEQIAIGSPQLGPFAIASIGVGFR